MDIRQLRYFVQIVDSGSLSKASRQLHIVQPALSQQMSRLEAEVGKPLLLRSVRGVTATESGEALYHHARLVLRQLDEAVHVARQEVSTGEGRVTLGLAPSTACVLGLPLLRHLQDKYPKILLNVVVAPPVQQEERARQGELDLAILFSKTAARELRFEHLLDEEIAVIAPAESPLIAAGKMNLTLAEVACLPLVLSSGRQHLRPRLMLEFERARLVPHITAEIDALELVMRFVAEGGGVTIQPLAAIHAARTPEFWRCLPLEDVSMVRPNYLYSLRAQQLSQAAAIVRTELRHLVRQLVQCGAWRGVKLDVETAEGVQSSPLP